jgi:hypothetical protein
MCDMNNNKKQKEIESSSMFRVEMPAIRESLRQYIGLFSIFYIDMCCANIHCYACIKKIHILKDKRPLMGTYVRKLVT